MYAYVGSQADKMKDAVNGMNQLLNKTSPGAAAI